MAGYTVYMHTFPNGKRYVGITCQDVRRRWRKGQGYEGQIVYNAILKYGWKNIRHEILFTNLTKEEAEAKEVALIRIYETTSHKGGYNIELGGKSVGMMSEETKRKLSVAHKGKQAGAKHWHYGKHWDEETKAKIRQARLGTKQSEEAKQKQKERFSGKNNPMYGVKMTTEHKKKLQAACVEATSKPVMCIETGVLYKSANEAQRLTGICAGTIRTVCRKDPKYKKAGGFHWEYAERSR